jgi:hypothetical protein
VTYETTPTPPEAPRIGGRPRLWGDLADAIRSAPPGHWVIVPSEGRSTTNAALLVTLRRTYFPDHKIKSKTRGGDLYVRLHQPKETAR